MHLKSALVLLSCSCLADADRRDDSTRYLRKLKKDKGAKNDQGFISTEMLKTFDMSDNRIGFGDWMGFVNTTMGTESVEFESSEEGIEGSIDLNIELDAVYNVSGSDEPIIAEDTAYPSPAPESLDLGLDTHNSVPDNSTEILVVDTTAPVASPDEASFDSAQEEEPWNHGATAISARKSGTITFSIPNSTHVGDTLFLFLRYVHSRWMSMHELLF